MDVNTHLTFAQSQSGAAATGLSLEGARQPGPRLHGPGTQQGSTGWSPETVLAGDEGDSHGGEGAPDMLGMEKSSRQQWNFNRDLGCLQRSHLEWVHYGEGFTPRRCVKQLPGLSAQMNKKHGV